MKPSLKTRLSEFFNFSSLSKISGPVIFFLIVIGLIFVMSVIFRVNTIEVIGNEHYTKEEIISAVDIEEGDNLFFFDRFAAISRVFAKLPYVEEVFVSRSLPDKVTIELKESKALAYLIVGDEKWTLDQKCKVLGKAAEGETQWLIAVTGINPGTLLIGEQLTVTDYDDIVPYLSEVLTQIEDRNLVGDIRSIDFSNRNSVKFDYTDKYSVILGDAYKVEYKFGMFLAAIEQLKPGDYGEIDVTSAMTAVFTPY